MLRFALAAPVAVVLSLTAAAFAQPAQHSTDLDKLLTEQVDYLMREDPIRASTRGDMRFNDKLRDESPAAYERRGKELADRLARLKALDHSKFGGDDKLNADLLEYDLSMAIEGQKFHREQLPINSMDGPHISLPQICDSIPLQSDKEKDDYITRMAKMPAQIEQQITQMRLGLKEGRVPPKVVLSNTVAQILEQATPEIEADPTTSPFYRPFLRTDKSSAFSIRACQEIRDGLVPAYRRLAAFMKDEYIPHCRDTIGAAQSSDGEALYAYLLRYHTTTDMTPKVVNMQGQLEVTRIKREMIRVIDLTDWPDKDKFSNPNEKFAAFTQYLRTDPRFYFKDEQSLLGGYRDLCKRIDAQLPKFFRTLPRNTYGVRAVPAFAAPTAAAGSCNNGSIRSGVPGYFMVNTYQLDQRPKYWMVSLTLHESVPGHHLQLSIADELEGVHEYRTLTDYTSYVEGWALYCEGMGVDMNDDQSDEPRLTGLSPKANCDPNRGFYCDPYDYEGRLSDEIWRACRLVVDTGLHTMNWTRQQAIDYMLANSAGTETDTAAEIDRYISWPGQACAYKIGELKIKELRDKAKAQLGEKFDIRTFHDTLLGGGVLPLPVLEKRMDRWIKQQTK